MVETKQSKTRRNKGMRTDLRYPRFITEVMVTSCYVSSTANHFYCVVLISTSYRRTWDYSWETGTLGCKRVRAWSPTKYLKRMVISAIKNAVTQKTMRYYEIDRDGNERYEDLRYHDESHEKIVLEHETRGADA